MKLLSSIDENKDAVTKEYVDNANVASATKLQTARTIGIGAGATGTATSFDGTKDITIPITDVKDTYVTWGGKAMSTLSPDDMGCVDEFSHNKLAFLPASKISVEYTTDEGETWLDYGLTDSQKVNMVTTSGTYCKIGKGVASAKDGTMTNENCKNYKVRVTLTGVGSLYTICRKILLNMSTDGANGSKVKVEARTYTNYSAGEDIWRELGTYTVAGWSGWNSLPISTTFGGANSWSDAQYRFTLSIESVNTSYTCQAALIDFRMIGLNNWSTPSEMARVGHLYTVDANKNAIFPSKVTSDGFIGNLDGKATKLDVSDTREINNPPSYYMGQGKQIFYEFKNITKIDNPFSSGTLCVLETICPWNNNSGGLPVQLATSNVSNKIVMRVAINDNSWGEWKSIALSDDVPTKTSDLTNDSNFVVDANYVHTDNNYTTTEKNKLSGIDEGAQVNTITGVKGDSESSYRTGNVNITKANIGLGNVENKSSATIRGELTSSNVTTALGYTPINSNLKGANNGLAELDANGKVPSAQLPSYVDDVIEYTSQSDFPTTGEAGKIYIAQDTNITYRWSGTAYVEISPSLALGETSSTAYRGDRGKVAYDHSQSTHARTDATAVASSTTNGNIKINGTETTVYSHPTSGVIAGTYKSVTVDGNGHVTGGSNPTTLSGYGITDAKINNGTITLGSNSITPLTSYTETDPIFSASVAADISSTDISNWNGKQAALVSGTNIKTVNGNSLLGSGDITISGGSSSYNDLTNKPQINGNELSGNKTAAQLGFATVATSGSYNDLSNKPSIPTVNNGTLTIQKNGSTVATFTANQSGGSTANITVPGVYNGTGAPASTLGSDGDIYIQLG